MSETVKVEQMMKPWKTISTNIDQRIRTQDEAECTKCGKTRHGLWSVQDWMLKDQYLKSNDAFLHCNKCDAVYCEYCIRELPGKRECMNCGEKLKNKALKIFYLDPKIHTIWVTVAR